MAQRTDVEVPPNPAGRRILRCCGNSFRGASASSAARNAFFDDPRARCAGDRRCAGRAGRRGVFAWRYFSSYESTDDAQVDGHLMPLSARISGYVTKVNVDDNQYVQAGTVLVEIDPSDYQVALDQAQANLADAEAQRAVAGHQRSDHVREYLEPDFVVRSGRGKRAEPAFRPRSSSMTRRRRSSRKRKRTT